MKKKQLDKLEQAAKLIRSVARDSTTNDNDATQLAQVCNTLTCFIECAEEYKYTRVQI